MRPTTITLTRRNAITVATLTLAARAACARRIRQMERQAERRKTPLLALPTEQQRATLATRAAAQPLHSREAWRRGRALAERELPDLEARLSSEIVCTPEDREALAPAVVMRQRGELWLAGYAALLWRRLVAAEPVEAYYGASGRANVWDGTLNDGLQRLDARAWNLVSSDLWAAWADGEAMAEREA